MKSVFLSLIALLVMSSCSRTTAEFARIVYLTDDRATISMRCTATGDNREKAAQAARREAIKTLLFRGVAGSQQSRPLIEGTEDAALQQHPQYFQQLFEQQHYERFVTQSVVVVPFARNNGEQGKTITLDVRIHLEALRKDLESNGIVRRFGL